MKSNYKGGENMSKNKQMKNNNASSKKDVEIPNDGLAKLALKAQKNKDLLTALQNLTWCFWGILKLIVIKTVFLF